MAWGANLSGVQAELTGGGAEMHVEPGPRPSRGWIVVDDEEAKSIKQTKAGLVLSFEDNEEGNEVSPVYVESVANVGAGISRLNLVDSRKFWKRRYITLYANILNDDKVGFNPKTTPKELYQQGYTFKEILKKCLDALVDAAGDEGYPQPGIRWDEDKWGKIDDADEPVLKDISWEAEPAGEKAAEILALFGGTISVSLDGDIVVTHPDEDFYSGHESAVDDKLTGESTSDAPVLVDKPDKIKIKYRILREKLFKNECWEAVLPHDGLNATGGVKDEDKRGEWLPADDVLEDWGFTLREIHDKYFTLDHPNEAFDLKNSDLTKRKHLSDIKGNLYRVFRYKQPGSDTDVARNKILPFHNELGTFVEPISGEAHNIEPYAKNCWMFINTGAPESQDTALIAARVPTYAVELIDADQGVIRFNTEGPVTGFTAVLSGKYKGDYKIDKPTNVQVVMAYVKKFAATTGLKDDYYVASDEDGIEDSWSGLEGSGQTEEIIDDSAYMVERDLDATGSFTAYNDEALDSFAEKYAEDYFNGFLSAQKNKPRDVVVGRYFYGLDRLCGAIRFMKFTAGPRGYSSTYRLYNDKPLNPHSKNYVEAYVHGGPRTIGLFQGAGMSRIAGRLVQHGHTGANRRGLMEHSRTPTRFPRGHYGNRLPGLVNPQEAGIGIAWDNSYSKPDKGGSKDKTKPRPKVTGGNASDTPNAAISHHSKMARVVEHDGTRATLDRVWKFASCFNHGAETHEATLIAPNAPKGNKGEEKSAPPPQITGGTHGHYDSGGGGRRPGYVGPANMGTADTGKDSTASKPGGTPGKDPNKSKNADSTFIWTDEPESNEKAKKGALRNVLMVGEHRPISKDPDDYQICLLEIDKGAKHHSTDANCGPLLDIGRHRQPPKRGIKIAVDQIYDPLQDGWVYQGYVPYWMMPTEPPPTPGPPPPPAVPPPPVATPGPGSPGPGPGGGSTPPGGSPPVVTPPGGAPAGGAGGGEPVETGAGTADSGSEEPNGGAGDGAEPGGKPWGGPDYEWTYPNWTPRPSDAQPPGPEEAGEAADDENWLDWLAHLSGESRYDIHNAYARTGVDNYFTRETSHAPKTYQNSLWSTGTASIDDPYSPGTGLGINTMWPERRGSSYSPGSDPIPIDELGNYEIDDVPTSYDWDGTTMNDERPDQSDFDSHTVGGLNVDFQNQMNVLHDRVAILDGRDRAAHNITVEDTMAGGAFNLAYTTADAYTGTTDFGVQCTSGTAGWETGFSVTNVAQNADGTISFDVTSQAAAPPGGGTVVMDIKGEVPADEDIDP
jgi:hypothetical protein